MTRADRNLGETLRHYAFALASVITIATGVILTMQDDRLDLRRVLSTIGLNLVASVVFAIVFATISSRVQERVLQESSEQRIRLLSSQVTGQLEERFNELSSQMTQQLATTNTQYFPAKTYQAANAIGEDFNRDISESLRRTGLYLFRGTSAKYVAARVKASRRQLQELKVVTLDPGSERVLRPRAVDRQRIPRNRGKSVEDLIAEIQNEILMSMVALFDCRQICSIEVTYAAETAVTRADLFDDAVYLSWYHGPLSTVHTFPEAFRFNAGSFLYDIQRSETFRRFEVAELGRNKFGFDSSQQDTNLISYLEKATNRSISHADLANWRREYERFSAPFIATIEQL